MYGEDPLKNPDYGKMINRKHFDRVLGLMKEEKLILGGENDTASLRIAPAVMDHLAEKGYDPAYGARPLRRLIQREIEDAIAEQYLAGKIQDHDVIFITLDANHKITIEKRNEIV